MKTEIPQTLSPDALDELRVIVKEQIVEPMTDAEIEMMGVRLLRLFSLLSIQETKQPDVEQTEQEQRAIAFIGSEMKQGKAPSIRGITKAIGLRSSRSGFRLVEQLISKGFVMRDGEGNMCLKKQK